MSKSVEKGPSGPPKGSPSCPWGAQLSPTGLVGFSKVVILLQRGAKMTKATDFAKSDLQDATREARMSPNRLKRVPVGGSRALHAAPGEPNCLQLGRRTLKSSGFAADGFTFCKSDNL